MGSDIIETVTKTSQRKFLLRDKMYLCACILFCCAQLSYQYAAYESNDPVSNRLAKLIQRVVSQEAFYEDDAEVPTYFQSPQERRAAQLRELLHPGERDLTGGKSATKPDRFAKSGKTSRLKSYGGNYRGGMGKRGRFICPPAKRSTHSKKTSEPGLTITVNNWADVPAQLVWIDYQGARRNVADPIPPGGTKEIKTFPGRVYVAYAARGTSYQLMVNYKCLWYVTAGDNFAAITE